MEVPIVDCNYLYSLDYENKLCVDCKSAMPQFVSINNAVIICKECAMKHKALGYNISYVREIQDEWDPYLLAFMLRGGNGRFMRLIRNYNIENLAIECKYITKATEYYRLLIKSEVYAEEPPESLLKPKGIEYCDLNANYFPEFENYQIYQGEKQPGSSTSTYTGKFYKAVENGFGFIYKTLSQSDIKEKAITGSVLTYNVLKVAGGFIFRTSKPVMNFVSKKATEGIGFIYNQMKDNFLDENIPGKSSIKQNVNKSSMKKNRTSIRPRSIGKESIRKSSIGNANKRSISTGKDLMKAKKKQMKKDKIDKNYCLDKNDVTSSISLIDENDEFYFVPVNDYPTYEEIMKYTQTNVNNSISISNSNDNIPIGEYNYHDSNNNINQPYQDINQYKYDK